MEGKKNPYDPAELFKQWLDNASKMQSDFTNNVNPFQANIQNTIFSNTQWRYLIWIYKEKIAKIEQETLLQIEVGFSCDI